MTLQPEHNQIAKASISQLRRELEPIREAVNALVHKQARLGSTYADDVFQTVIQQLLEMASRGIAPTQGSWISLARTIAQRRLMDIFREQGREHTARDHIARQQTQNQHIPDQMSSHLTRAIHDAIALLNPEHQELLRLRFLAGLKLRQIAKITDKPLPTVYSILESALEQLRGHLERDEILRSTLDQEWPRYH